MQRTKACNGHRMAQTTWNNLRVLVPLLLLATAAVNLTAVQIHNGWPWPTLTTAIVFASAFAQTSILAVWLGLGRGLLIIRFGTLIAAITFWTYVLSDFRMSDGIWALGLGVLSVSVLGGVLLLRAFGNVLSIVEPAGEIALRDSRFQFSLGHMFLGMTLAAGAAFGARFVDYAVWPLAVITAPFSLTAVLAAWSVLAIGNPARRILLLAFIAPLLGAAGHYWRFSSAENCLANGGMCALHGLLIVAALSVFRVGGYRLVRNQTSSAERSSCVA